MRTAGALADLGSGKPMARELWYAHVYRSREQLSRGVGGGGQSRVMEIRRAREVFFKGKKKKWYGREKG